MHIYYPQIKIAHFCVQLTATSLAAACKTGDLLNVCHLCVIFAVFVCTQFNLFDDFSGPNQQFDTVWLKKKRLAPTQMINTAALRPAWAAWKQSFVFTSGDERRHCLALWPLILRCGLLRLCMMAGCPPDQGTEFSRPLPFSSSEKTETNSDGSATGGEGLTFLPPCSVIYLTAFLFTLNETDCYTKLDVYLFISPA